MENVALLLQVRFQRRVVFNDAVVNNGNPLRSGIVGVGILVVGLAVGGPAGVAHADVSMGVFGSDKSFELTDLTFFLVDVQLAVEQGYASGVVTPIFKPMQTFNNDGAGLTIADISNNAAHGREWLMVEEADSGSCFARL